MTSCLSGAVGRTYGFNFDFVKSPSTSWTLTSPSTSSPSSTISETSNSPRAISTKKPRNPRKRRNQTYNEAATLLSTAYPNLFSTKNLKKPSKFTKPTIETNFSYESSELLLPFRVYDASSFLLHQTIQHKPCFQTEPKAFLNLLEKPCTCQSPGEISSKVMNSTEIEDDFREDFDCESILDEEIIEEGIDSIMGSNVEDSNGASCGHGEPPSSWFGFGGKQGFRAGLRAFRHVDGGNWWNFPAVDILEISTGMKNTPATAPVPVTAKKKMKNKKKMELRDSKLLKGNSNQGLLLKLNYDEVRNAWSDRGSPFAGDCSGSGVPENDVTAEIDLFAENGGVREASVLRYKEKRRTRLFSTTLIRYQVRKVNADRRPRMKVSFS